MSKKFILKVQNISKQYEEKKILKSVSFSLYFGQKIALIGANGSGKSTLAKIITQEIKQDSGTIESPPHTSISYLPQEVQENFLVSEYIQKRSQAFRLIQEFGFSHDIFEREIRSLSGGEKTKIFLIKITLEKSDVIILDEPTNNLDTEGINYLENTIKSSKSCFLIISHDRAFLDKTVSHILFLNEDTKNLESYSGNYSDFIQQKDSAIERTNMLAGENQRQKKKIEKEISTLQSRASVDKKVSFSNDNDKYIDFNKTARNLKKNSSRLKATKGKLEHFEEREKIAQKRPLKIDFSEMKNSGNNVLKAENLLLKHGTQNPINLEIFSGDRVLISGKNGAGKTTFLHTILDSLKKESGEKPGNISWGTNLTIGYLPQDFLSENISEKIFLDYFYQKTGKDQSDSRKILARFGFAEEEIFSKIKDLSPGLRGRGKIATMLANNPNMLILDEPTNNLDLEVLEKLEEALDNYKGTILFTSHDSYFIEKIKPTKNLLL